MIISGSSITITALLAALEYKESYFACQTVKKTGYSLPILS